MTRRFSTIQKCAFALRVTLSARLFAGLCARVMDANGKMFGLFSMTTFVDIGHLGLGTLALISGFIGPRASRIYFWFLGFFYAADVITYVIRHLHLISPVTNLLVNMPHILISIAAFLIAINVGKNERMPRSRARKSSPRSVRLLACLVLLRRSRPLSFSLFTAVAASFSSAQPPKLCAIQPRPQVLPTTRVRRWIRSTPTPSGTSCGAINQRPTFSAIIFPLDTLTSATSANSGKHTVVFTRQPAAVIHSRRATTLCSPSSAPLSPSNTRSRACTRKQ